MPRPCSCDAQASVPRVVEAWEASAPPISAWTSRLFFASIGFAVPATELFSAEALGYGALLTAIAICSKVVTGVFEWDSKFSIGWAMVGRGELGLVMAEEAYRTGLTDELTFAATVGRPPSRCYQTSRRGVLVILCTCSGAACSAVAAQCGCLTILYAVRT